MILLVSLAARPSAGAVLSTFPLTQKMLLGLGVSFRFYPLPPLLSSGRFNFLLSFVPAFLLPGNFPCPPLKVCGVIVVTAVLNWFFSSFFLLWNVDCICLITHLLSPCSKCGIRDDCDPGWKLNLFYAALEQTFILDVQQLWHRVYW